MVYFTQSKGHVCKSLVKARKPWLLLVIKRVVRHIFPACFGKICAASVVDCQSSADTAKRIIMTYVRIGRATGEWHAVNHVRFLYIFRFLGHLS